MARISLTLLAIAMAVVVVSGRKLIGKEMYRPYGIKMCEELRHHSNDCFIYTVETLTCYRVSSNDSAVNALKRTSTGTFVSCPMEKYMLNGSTTALAVLLRGDFHAEQSKGTSLVPKPGSSIEPYRPTTRVVTARKKEDASLAPTQSRHLQSYTETALTSSLVVTAEKKEDTSLTPTPTRHVKPYKSTVLTSFRGVTARQREATSLVLTLSSDVEPYTTAQDPGQVGAAWKKEDETETKAASSQESTTHTLEVDEPILSNQIENITLHKACAEGKLDVVQYILSEGLEDINCKDVNGCTPVMYAVWHGHKAVVDLLMLKGCNLQVVDYYKNTILHVACRGGYVDMIKYIISKQSININVRGYHGRTPVMLAAMVGNVKAIDLLRTKGCEMENVDDDGNSILHLACSGGHVDSVKYIISKNIVNINVRGCSNKTAVMVAARMGYVRVVDVLIKQGCDVKAVNAHGNNILHSACCYGNVDMVKFIISKQIVSINVRGSHERTPVMFAAEFGHVEVVKLLMRKGCDMKLVDDCSNNILHIACSLGSVDVVRYLIGLDIVSKRQANKFGNTPIQMARSSGHGEVVTLLKARE